MIKLLILIVLIQLSKQQFTTQPTTGAIQQTIYQFMQTLPNAAKFLQTVNSIASNLQDNSIINALQGNPSPMYQSQNGYTVFVPTNDALNNLPTDFQQLRNDFSNFIVRDRLTLDRLRELSGRNLTATFGILPRLYVRVVRNFYRRNLNPTINTPLTGTTTMSYNNQNPYNPNQNQQQQMNNNSNLYNYYNSLYGGGSNSQYNGPAISLQFPQDELFLINDAILLDKYELNNGIIYIMSSYPRYYDQSLFQLLQSNSVPGLSQNLNFLQSEATRARRAGNDNLENALKVVGPNTYFLPADAGFQKFADRDKLSNFTFLYEILFKSHRVSNQIIFDYYLDGPTTYYTDTLLPINTEHSRLTGSNVDNIDISIGHVRGKILPDLRNIFCFSGIIHVVDTVLAVPTRTAYQELMTMTQLGTFRQLIDRSSKYRQLLDQQPTNIVYPTQPPLRNMQVRNGGGRSKRQFITNSPFDSMRYMTILAPNEAALFNIRDILLSNDTALDQFLSSHIIIDNESNRLFYTDHDANVFQNGVRYSTMNPAVYLIATVTQIPTETSNRVTLQVQNSANLQTRIIDGDVRTSNGVLHIVDRVLIPYVNPDISTVLDKYSTSSTGGPSFSQFLEALKSTGIYNELKVPSRQFTVFIPTNDALSKFQSVVNTNDLNLRKQILLTHIAEGLMLNKENTTELADTNKEIELRKNSKIKIERPDNNEDTYIVTSDGNRVRVLEHLEAENGNIFLIDSLLHSPNSKEYSYQLHGYGRNSMSSGDSSFYQSKAYDYNTASSVVVTTTLNYFIFVFLIFFLI